jgi:hypothetical protein
MASRTVTIRNMRMTDISTSVFGNSRKPQAPRSQYVSSAPIRKCDISEEGG